MSHPSKHDALNRKDDGATGRSASVGAAKRDEPTFESHTALTRSRHQSAPLIRNRGPFTLLSYIVILDPDEYELIEEATRASNAFRTLVRVVSVVLCLRSQPNPQQLPKR